jgi:broad specificity phosphatase PhoE
VTSVYLVRHAKALDRSTWSEPDHLRPLSKTGYRQAAALPGHFGAVPFQQILSSPLVRCTQTMAPLAEALGLDVEDADELAEGGSGSDALELVLAVAESGPVAACTHGDVLLDALATLRALDVSLPGPLECKKGSTWVLEVEGGSFRKGTYLRPPALERE